ncbi:MAG TPA: glycosyltransferase family 4 protein [Bdellovibrionota bacterium]|nr:glycosyltransferase family 4 protein [Bdellovibrionota bacterium]
MTPNNRSLPARILMTSDTIGGVWTYALTLARELSDSGTEIALATMGRSLTREQRKAASKIKHLEVFESAFRLEWMSEPWEDVEKAEAWLLDIEARVRPKLVHLNHFCHTAIGWQSPKLVVAHSDVYSWYKAVRGTPPGGEWNRYREEVSRHLRAADLIVTPTSAMRDSLEYFYGPLETVRVIPNGTRSDRFRPATKSEYILSVGRLWDESKNIRTLDLAADGLPWPTVVIGSRLAPGMTRGDAITFSNVLAIDELPHEALTRYFEEASIYASPAKYEPFGLSALEAALNGCALVLGDIPSLREIWRDSAVFVDPEDPARLKETLWRLIHDRESREELSRRARARALVFGAEQMCDSYRREYRGLVESVGGPPG